MKQESAFLLETQNSKLPLVTSTSGNEQVQQPFLLTPGRPIRLEDIEDIALRHRRVEMSPEAITAMERSRAHLDRRLGANEVIYGVNTGFGGNSDLVIPPGQVAELQTNLLTFLTAGTGDFLPTAYVRAAMLLTALALIQGWSAVRPKVVQALIDCLNHDIVARVPRHGSVGASGDLIPSSYIASALCGRGWVFYCGRELEAGEALLLAGLEPLVLEAKEGLALVNGTRIMTAIAALSVIRMENTFRAALGALAIAVEALQASREHLDERIHRAKGHPGQIWVAQALREVLHGSKMCGDREQVHRQAAKAAEAAQKSQAVTQAAHRVQDVYSLRCAAQVTGVLRESLDGARVVVEREAVSVNDNPLIDPETGDVLHGGNFMGQHIARAMDGLKIDMAILANEMHSIMALLMDNRFSGNLPNSLSPKVGLYQGFKGVQLSHTALVAHLRRESAPSCVHTLPTEQFNQDVVSLGTHAALTAAEMETKLRDLVAMTLLAAVQAVDLRGETLRMAPCTAAIRSVVREVSPQLVEDRALDGDIAAVSRLIFEGKLNISGFDMDQKDRERYA